MKLVCGLAAVLLLATVPAEDASSQSPFEEQVWYTPNVGSVDMLDLFTSPELWTSARSRIDVFKFYTGQVGSGGWSCTVHPESNCGQNHLQNFIDIQAFEMLELWDIDIAIESFFAGPVMSVDPIVCSTSEYVFSLSLDGSLNVIQNVQANGGTVRYLAMDEPIRQWYPEYFYIYTGQTDPRPCLANSLGSLADDVAAYILQMQTWFPSIPIGQIGLYPEVGIDQFKEWVLALEARGVTLPFLHLDVDGPRVDQYISWGIPLDVAADLAELKTFLAEHSIAFGVIFTDIYWNSQVWEEDAYTDSTYFASALDWFDFIQTTNVAPNHSIFQSWVYPVYVSGLGPNEIPINLPENDPAVYSHTRLINTALGPTVGVEAKPPLGVPADLLLRQNSPNPFNPATVIDYEVPTSAEVTLKVCDVRGREIRTLVSGYREPGIYSVGFDAGELPSGVYFYQLQIGNDLAGTRKMLLLK